jgi:plastocyanin
MATGAFFNSLGYRFYVKLGTTASTNTTSSTGLTEVLSLTKASIQGTTQTQDILDYGSTLGYTASIVQQQSYNIPMQMNLNLNDAGYLILKQAAMEAATGTTVEWYRESPEMTTTGDPEYHSGVAWVTEFSESIAAGNVAQVTFTLTGYGAYDWTAETNA